MMAQSSANGEKSRVDHLEMAMILAEQLGVVVNHIMTDINRESRTVDIEKNRESGIVDVDNNRESGIVDVDINRESGIVDVDINRESGIVDVDINRESGIVDVDNNRESGIVDVDINRESGIVDVDIDRESGIVDVDINRDSDIVDVDINRESGIVDVDVNRELGIVDVGTASDPPENVPVVVEAAVDVLDNPMDAQDFTLYAQPDVEGPPILDKLANLVKFSVTQPMDEGVLSEKTKLYLKPKNCPEELCVCELTMEKITSVRTSESDSVLQKIQLFVVHALIAMAESANIVATTEILETGNVRFSTSSNLLTKITDGIDFLCAANQTINYKRLIEQKAFFNAQYNSICSKNNMAFCSPSVYGDDVTTDIAEANIVTVTKRLQSNTGPARSRRRRFNSGPYSRPQSTRQDFLLHGRLSAPQ